MDTEHPPGDRLSRATLRQSLPDDLLALIAGVKRNNGSPMPERWIDRRAVGVGVVLGLASLALGVLAAFYDTFPLDERVSAVARDLGPRFEPIANLANDKNRIIAITVCLLGIVVGALRRQIDVALLFVLSAPARELLEFPKDLVDRPRPVGDFAVLDTFADSSFPSGHVMTATTFFGLWFLLAPALVPPRWVQPVRLAVAVIIPLYATSRMWAGVHLLSDTYGSVLWAGTALAVLLAIRPALQRMLARAHSFSQAATDR